MEPRDETVFLLTVAAEIEHALMVQYLFAAYSVRVIAGDPNERELAEVQRLLTQIAREEMGHLATMENLLHLVGGPLNFNREHSPYASQIYPFRFKLQALTLDSLAKYVIAESPEKLPPMPPEDVALLTQIRLDAIRSNDGQEVRHVGPIFARLQELFERELADGDFRLDTFERQAKFENWGFQPRAPRPGELAEGEALIIDSFPGVDVAKIREAAVSAVRRVGAQGEGFDPEPVGVESHFERFFVIYKRVRELSSAGVVITWPVAENPNTTLRPAQAPGMADLVEMVQEAHASKGRITHPRARAWAQLFNLRYRMLLGRLSHFLRLDQDIYRTDPGARQGDPTARGLLLIWTFDEMRRLRKIAIKLVQLPKDDPPGELHAGPPFELPYTLNLPEDEPQRWRTHLDASRAADRLIREKLQPDDQTADRDEFLDDLLRLDEEAQVVMRALAAGRDIPPDSLPSDFQKVVRILEEAVRGFTIGGPHASFWAGKNRDAFLNTSPLPTEPVVG
ncbi:MAG: ferritin-like domain-containing protein, partial [Actinomycetota bacterium]